MILIAASWGLAEAILLFIVADVPISAIAVRHGLRGGIIASLYAALGASAGGALAYAWASIDPAGAAHAMLALPAIDAPMLILAISDFHARGYQAVLGGSFSGVPFKLYALAAAADEEPLLRFAAMTPLLRLPRFLLVTLVSASASRLLARWIGMPGRLVTLGLLWLVFYAFYFSAMPG